VIIERWAWFEPDPVGMSEDELERLVQQRRMKPLWLDLPTTGQHSAVMQVYIVPLRVLARPKNPYSSRWRVGEPWCHSCNTTFFWDKNVREVPSYPVGGNGIGRGTRCLLCGHTVA
jgi:hypothetical protein